MKIKILNATYRIGSGRGINYLQNPKAVEELNEIINWEESIFPPDLNAEPTEQEVRLSQEGETRGCCIQILEAQMQGMSEEDIDKVLIPQLEEATGKKINKTDDGWYTMMAKVYPENREYLGNPPRLKPGNVFEFDGQMIAVDKDPETGEERLILYNSDSGPMALERIYKEHISVEHKLKFPPEDSFFDLTVKKSDMIPFANCDFLEEGETRLEDIFDEDREVEDEFLASIWRKKKLEPEMWRHFLKSFPGLKESLENNIFQLICCPNFDDLTFYIDKRGTLIYSIADCDEEEFEIYFTCFWPGLWEYLDSIPELKETKPTISDCNKG